MQLQHVAIGISAGGAETARAFYGDLLGLEERSVPDGVDVRKVDLSIELQILAFHEQRKAGGPSGQGYVETEMT